MIVSVLKKIFRIRMRVTFKPRAIGFEVKFYAATLESSADEVARVNNTIKSVPMMCTSTVQQFKYTLLKSR